MRIPFFYCKLFSSTGTLLLSRIKKSQEFKNVISSLSVFNDSKNQISNDCIIEEKKGCALCVLGESPCMHLGRNIRTRFISYVYNIFIFSLRKTPAPHASWRTFQIYMMTVVADTRLHV